MTAAITLAPGRATLADWRAAVDGAAVRLDPAAMPAVEAMGFADEKGFAAAGFRAPSSALRSVAPHPGGVPRGRALSTAGARLQAGVVAREHDYAWALLRGARPRPSRSAPAY
jgi:hypothetical protein